MKSNRLVWASIATLVCAPVLAQQMFVYPSKGQTPQQQQADEYQCYQWAVGQTGFDPVNPPPKPGQPAPAPTGVVAKNVAGAALMGTGIAAATGGSKSGGAAVGAMIGGMRGAQKAKQQAAQQAAQQQAQQQAGPTAFGKARAACLVGHGYTVS